MTTMRMKTAVAAALGVLLVSGASAEAQHAGHGGQMAGGKDIVQVATEAGTFRTLLAAAQAAGLVETLKGTGPFTVFAPTDEAFAKLPHGTVDRLLQNREQLRAVLTYHVVPGRVTAAQVVRLNEAGTVQGSKVRIRASGGKVMINDSNVVTTDVAASNGVIHVIDSVLMPPARH